MSEQDEPAEAQDRSSDRTLASLHRHAVRTDLALGKVLGQLGLAAPTDEQTDAVLGER